MNELKKKLQLALVRWLLIGLIGRKNIPMVEAAAEEARREKYNMVAQRAHVYREVKKVTGGHLSVNDTNLAADLAIKLDAASVGEK